jgi:hypothetical protein
VQFQWLMSTCPKIVQFDSLLLSQIKSRSQSASSAISMAYEDMSQESVI